MTRDDLTDEQRGALDELRSLSSRDSIEFVDSVADGGELTALVHVNTAQFEQVDGGLPVVPIEPIFLSFPQSYPWTAPTAFVNHDRWVGHAHVLQGERLCLYLNPDAEWNPSASLGPFLDRLWNWLADAAANRFDSATALYHPVGGVLHRTIGAPTLVVPDVLGELTGFSIREIALRPGGAARVDVAPRSTSGDACPPDEFRGLLVVLSGALPRGGGRSLSDLAIAIRGQDSRRQRKQLLAAVEKTARGLSRDQHLHVLIAVPHGDGNAVARHHLVGWRLPASEVADAVRATRRRHKAETPHADDDPKVEWTYVDDLRTTVTVRRDGSRPVFWFAGRTVELWGCGALGSWIAEQLVRAGVAKLTLRDPALVTSGLLVRQNYLEADVGRPKAEALADRLRTIARDGTVIDVKIGSALTGLPCAEDVEAIFDCTVSNAVAVAVDELQRAAQLEAPVIQVATDVDSACLGVMTIAGGSLRGRNSETDAALRDRVDVDPASKAYSIFWNRNHHATLIPTVGCSEPTFHGSSADAMAIAATAISIASDALAKRLNGGFLWASPHAGVDAPGLIAVPPTT